MNELTVQDIYNKIVLVAIEKAKDSIAGFRGQKIDEKTCLFGESGAILDSLNLVSFVFILEETAADVAGRKITIAAEDLSDTENNPFRDLLSLSRLLERKLESSP